MIPFKITGKDFEVTEAIHNVTFDHVQSLSRFYSRIHEVDVSFSEPHCSQRKGRIFQITIRLHIPGPDIVVSREPARNASHEDFYVALSDAFEVAKRRLEEQVRKMRGFVKQHNGALPHAKVFKLFGEDGFGFLRTPEGREIYFHKNSLVSGRFGSLKIGTEVRFSEELGKKGPQVTSMHVVGKNNHVLANVMR
jgi:ribosomal subunit interface protein